MMSHSRVCVSVALITWLVAVAVQAELFTAIVDLERVLRTEQEVAEDLGTYIESQQQRIDELKGIAANFERHSTGALSDPERHLSNPVNAFLLVKRFTADWDRVMSKFFRDNASNAFLESMQTKTSYFPNEEDLSGAALALLRLQDTYALSTEDLAHGIVQNSSDTSTMTASDCFELGRVAYLEKDFYHTVLWMSQALELLEQDDTSEALHRAYVLDYLSYALFMQDNVHEALRLSEELLKLDPTNERVMNNTVHYKSVIELNEVNNVTQSTEIKNNRVVDEYRKTEEFITYERLCRGEKTHIYLSARHLSCQLRRHHPLFYIRPLKEEVVYLEPRIVIFHDVISDLDIAQIKTLAIPRLNRATVQNAVTGKLETAHYRVSKSAWLKDEEHIRINRVSQIARAMTNLTLDTVEELQVVNYGIGGHYEPHFDFARKQDASAFEDWRGNRMATFICYMSDVEAGGATVFPVIGARLVPEKGACAVWYNLHRSGEGDFATRHAACPVLLGSKWVCNKWFHERGQEFIRPCSLSYDQ